MAVQAMRWPGRRRRAALAAFAIAVAGWGGVAAAGANETTTEDAGEAVLVADAGSTRRIETGGSKTRFSIRLPMGASCPGDSANDGYRVQSFMAPALVAAAAIEFDGLGPTPHAFGDWGTFRQPLYDVATRPLDTAFTAVAAAPGQPGPVVDLPVFSFAVYGQGELPPGRYRVGIACTLANEPVKFWDTEIEVKVQPDDVPAHISWRVVGDSRAGTGSAGGRRALLLAGGLIALAVLIPYSRQRLRSRASGEALEGR